MTQELFYIDGSPMREYTSPLLEELNKEEMEEQSKGLEYWKNNAEDNYMTTPISVLRYIGELEKAIEESKANHKTEHGKTWDESIDNYKARGENFVRAWEDFDDYYNNKFNKI
jgi:hypothetical protein